MILVDINILIYAHNTGAALHSAARAWVESAFSGSEQVVIPWAVAHAFLRLTTHGPLMSQPFTPAEACSIVDDWYAAPAVQRIEPGPRYWTTLRNLAITHNVRGALFSDAHLAALAIDHGATVYTTDRDFRRFDGVRVINPLV